MRRGERQKKGAEVGLFKYSFEKEGFCFCGWRVAKESQGECLLAVVLGGQPFFFYV